jgi:hypothetical protein
MSYNLFIFSLKAKDIEEIVWIIEECFICDRGASHSKKHGRLLSCPARHSRGKGSLSSPQFSSIHTLPSWQTNIGPHSEETSNAVGLSLQLPFLVLCPMEEINQINVGTRFTFYIEFVQFLKNRQRAQSLNSYLNRRGKKSVVRDYEGIKSLNFLFLKKSHVKRRLVLYKGAN